MEVLSSGNALQASFTSEAKAFDAVLVARTYPCLGHFPCRCCQAVCIAVLFHCCQRRKTVRPGVAHTDSLTASLILGFSGLFPSTGHHLIRQMGHYQIYKRCPLYCRCHSCHSSLRQALQHTHKQALLPVSANSRQHMSISCCKDSACEVIQIIMEPMLSLDCSWTRHLCQANNIHCQGVYVLADGGRHDSRHL